MPAPHLLTFGRATRRYWLEVFPATREELRYWRERAAMIPDPELRRDAYFTIDTKWGNCEGSAAFALLVPRHYRRRFVRMSIAYALMIDYLDTVSEQSAGDPYENTLQLHRALYAALGLEPPGGDAYYALHAERDDGGYLMAHIGMTRDAFVSLPSCRAVAPALQRFAALYAEAQGLCHVAEAGREAPAGPSDTRREADRHSELGWWEMVAAGSSSLPVLALLAAATWPGLSAREAEALIAAYYPWGGALNILLHGLAGQAADRASGQFNQIDHYRSSAEAAERLAFVAFQARARVSRLPQGDMHAAILAGLGGYYLASPDVWHPERVEISQGVLACLGPLVKPALRVHRLRQGRRGAGEAAVSVSQIQPTATAL